MVKIQESQVVTLILKAQTEPSIGLYGEYCPRRCTHIHTLNICRCSRPITTFLPKCILLPIKRSFKHSSYPLSECFRSDRVQRQWAPPVLRELGLKYCSYHSISYRRLLQVDEHSISKTHLQVVELWPHFTWVLKQTHCTPHIPGHQRVQGETAVLCPGQVQPKGLGDELTEATLEAFLGHVKTHKQLFGAPDLLEMCSPQYMPMFLLF